MKAGESETRWIKPAGIWLPSFAPSKETYSPDLKIHPGMYFIRGGGVCLGYLSLQGVLTRLEAVAALFYYFFFKGADLPGMRFPFSLSSNTLLACLHWHSHRGISQPGFVCKVWEYQICCAKAGV